MMLSIGRVEDRRGPATAVATVAAVVVLTAAPLLGASVYAVVVLTSLLRIWNPLNRLISRIRSSPKLAAM